MYKYTELCVQIKDERYFLVNEWTISPEYKHVQRDGNSIHNFQLKGYMFVRNIIWKTLTNKAKYQKIRQYVKVFD